MSCNWVKLDEAFFRAAWGLRDALEQMPVGALLAACGQLARQHSGADTDGWSNTGDDDVSAPDALSWLPPQLLRLVPASCAAASSICGAAPATQGHTDVAAPTAASAPANGCASVASPGPWCDTELDASVFAAVRGAADHAPDDGAMSGAGLTPDVWLPLVRLTLCSYARLRWSPSDVAGAIECDVASL
jgi:hypothetical protein